MSTEVIQLSHDQILHHLQCEKRTRRNAAYLIRDIGGSGILLLTQKLRLAADFINHRLARSQMERVTETGLFDAADTDGNRVNGFHKLRYHVTRLDIGEARDAFQQARALAGVHKAVILATNPDCYAIA
jgi:hypothetical protein